MTVLDRVKELKRQGYLDADIARTLQEEGISPREINNALAQSKIKEAVANNNTSIFPQEEMQLSVMDQPSQNQKILRQPMTQETSPGYEQTWPQEPMEPPIPFQENPEEQQYSMEASYPEQAYGQGQTYGYDQQAYGASIETISEISSQIVEDKMKKINKDLSSLIELKTLLTAHVEKIDERLERVESIIDQLQASLLRKASEQEQNIADIKTELENIEQGFGKIINPLVDEARKAQKPVRKTAPKKLKTTSKKRKQ